MKKNNLWVVIGVTLIVAIIVSLATVSISGRIVSVPSYTASTQAQVYSKQEVDILLSSKTTNQNVLNMLRTYDVGRCGYREEPIGSLWDPSDDDYFIYTKPYIDADKNKDTVTTGVEWCGSLNGTCITGYALSWISTSNFSGFIMDDPIGCAGGSLIRELNQTRARHNTYLCCKA